MNPNYAMNRRAVMQRMAFLLGATALPATVFATPKPSAKRVLKPAEFQSLSAVSDTIVPRTDTPGAVDAGIPAKFDALLADWASAKRRTELTQALVAIDEGARADGASGFSAMTAEKRLTFLRQYDLAALKPVPRAPSAGIAAMMAGPSVADPSYAKLKELLVILYYLSEPALTRELPYVHAPGQWKPSIPVTADTRPAGGPGSY